MPYTNEHTARQNDPAQYDQLRRFTPQGAPDGLSMILGITGDKSEVQSIRADADKLSPEKFREWLDRHSFDVSQFEEATRKSFDSFARWVPMSLDELTKARDEGDAEGDETSKAIIAGICSTRDMDLEGEVIEQDGLDWSYFLNNGWFNHEHQQGAGAVLGHPIKVDQLDDNRTHVEGVLYLDKQLGRDVYETAVAMKKAGGDRSLGFSVEGQVLLRDPLDKKRVLKARVLNVAITAHPVNPHTNLELIARSLGASVGYQAPTIPDADASLSALAQQSLDERVSSATYGEKSPKRVSRSQVRALIAQRMPELDDAGLDRLVAQLMRLASEKSRTR